MKHTVYAGVALLLAGCSAAGTPSATVTSTVTVTPQASSAASATAAPSASSASSAPVAPPGPATACTDDQLDVTNAPLESTDTVRRVEVTFRNTSSKDCTLVGYPGADLVTPAGGVLINVARRPANAAHRLTLEPNDAATADVVSSAVDSKTSQACPRYGTLVITPPNGFQARTLPVDLPICDATVSSVD